MQSPAAISKALQQRADADHERKRRKQIQPLRGLRGVQARDIVAVLVEAWKKPPRLPADAANLHRLFSTAFEDGLVAMGLLAAVLPDDPLEALDLADRWLEMVDDTETADTLGWLLLGPGLLAAQEPFVDTINQLRSEGRPAARRAAVMATMAALPVPIEGPAAAALRERTGQRRIAFVEKPLTPYLEAALPPFIRDTDAQVRKATARAMRSWGTFQPDVVEELIEKTKGGVPRYFREEVAKGIRKGRRLNKS
ncbi:MAG: DNA alkylation repair protein [Myxococcota bacterium]